MIITQQIGASNVCADDFNNMFRIYWDGKAPQNAPPQFDMSLPFSVSLATPYKYGAPAVAVITQSVFDPKTKLPLPNSKNSITFTTPYVFEQSIYRIINGELSVTVTLCGNSDPSVALGTSTDGISIQSVNGNQTLSIKMTPLDPMMWNCDATTQGCNVTQADTYFVLPAHSRTWQPSKLSIVMDNGFNPTFGGYQLKFYGGGNVVPGESEVSKILK